MKNLIILATTFLTINFFSLYSTEPSTEPTQAPAILNSSPKIGIIGVDSFELGDLLLSSMEKPINITTQGMREAYSGKLWGTDTVIFVSHEEKAAASSAVVDLILYHHVDLIIFIGTAGALDTRLNIGDIVIPEKLIQYDVDFSPEYPLFQLPLLRRRGFPTDKNLRKMAIKSAQDFLQQEFSTQISPEILQEMHIGSPKIVDDPIGTADCFLISKEQLLNLKEKAPDVSSIEMEGAAVAQTAADYQVPFVLIRTMANYVESPLPDENHRVAQDYIKFLKKVQWVYSEGIMKRLISRIKDEWKSQKTEINTDKSMSCDLGIVYTHPKQVQNLIKIFDVPLHLTFAGSRPYYMGMIGNSKVVIAPSGYGKAAVAATVTDMILRHKVKKIIHIGDALPVDESLKQGDVVISDILVEYDMDARPFRPIFQISTLSIIDIPTDKDMRNHVADILRRNFPEKKVVVGEMASADHNPKNPLEISHLKKELPALLCIDSEAAPAAQIAYQYGIPFVSVKTISEDLLEPKKLDPRLVKLLSSQ